MPVPEVEPVPPPCNVSVPPVCDELPVPTELPSISVGFVLVPDPPPEAVPLLPTELIDCALLPLPGTGMIVCPPDELPDPTCGVLPVPAPCDGVLGPHWP